MGVSSCRFSLKAINLTPCFNWLPGGFVSYVQVGWRCSKLSLSLCKIFTWKPAEIKDRKYSEFSRTNPYLYQPLNHWNEFQHWLTKWSIRTPKIETEIYHNIPQFLWECTYFIIFLSFWMFQKNHDITMTFPTKKSWRNQPPAAWTGSPASDGSISSLWTTVTIKTMMKVMAYTLWSSLIMLGVVSMEHVEN